MIKTEVKAKIKDYNLCKKCRKNPSGTIGNLELCRICAGKKIVKQSLLEKKIFVHG